MKKIVTMIVLVIVVVVSFVLTAKFVKKEVLLLVTNFEECVAAGNPVMESYPRQCRHKDKSFTEEIGNELSKSEWIRLRSPRPNQLVTSPLKIIGEARGNWFFEASFPVALTDENGLVVAQGIATAKSDWMTEDFVPFEAVLTFALNKNLEIKKGTLILRKDNPSSLPGNDDALEIPVMFSGGDVFSK